MNKSIIIGALLIGASIIASPFIFSSVKQYQREKEQEKMALYKEVADITALESAAKVYKKAKGTCPEIPAKMVGISIKQEPKDRYGLSFETNGDCMFQSSEGVTSTSY